MNIGEILGAKGALGDFLTKIQESQLNEGAVSGDAATLPAFLPQEDTVAFSPSALSRSKNRMSQNFVGGNTRDIKYLDAMLAGAASVQIYKRP